MGFPNSKELDSVLEELEKKEGTLALPENATPLEIFRWELCQKFIKYKKDNNITQREMAKRLGVDEGKVSKILHHRIDDFSTDRLITLYSKLDPNLRLEVG